MLPKHPVLPHFCCGARGVRQFHDWETEARLPLCLQMGFTSASFSSHLFQSRVWLAGTTEARWSAAR